MAKKEIVGELWTRVPTAASATTFRVPPATKIKDIHPELEAWAKEVPEGQTDLDLADAITESFTNQTADETRPVAFNLPNMAGARRSFKKAFSRNSIERLRELHFDPIGQMVECYEELSYEVRNMERIRSGTKPGKYSPMAHTQLLAAKQKICNDLMRYGYARVTEQVELNLVNKPQPSMFTLVGIVPSEEVIAGNKQITVLETLPADWEGQNLRPDLEFKPSNEDDPEY